MTDIIKIAALFILCNGVGCNCTQNPSGGTVDFTQIIVGIILYAVAAIINRYETNN